MACLAFPNSTIPDFIRPAPAWPAWLADRLDSAMAFLRIAIPLQVTSEA